MTATDLDRELDEMADRELERDARPASPAAVQLVRSHAQDDKSFAIITHLATIGAAVFSGGLLHVFVPAVAYALFRDKSDFLKGHTKSQLNFQLTFLLVGLVAVLGSIATFGIGAIVAVPVMVFYFVADIVCSIKAALAASRGEDYEMPFSVQFVK